MMIQIDNIIGRISHIDYYLLDDINIKIRFNLIYCIENKDLCDETNKKILI